MTDRIELSDALKLAIEFNTIESCKKNYYLRSALYSELNDNIVYIKDYISDVKKGNRQAVLMLDTYIWEAMKFSTSTMEIPDELLKYSRRFYRDTMFIYTNNINEAGAHYKSQQLQLILDDMEKNVMPLFVKDLDELKSILSKKYEIEV